MRAAILMVAIVCFACSCKPERSEEVRDETVPATEATPPAEPEQAVIPAELQAQLEAAGYLKKEEKKGTPGTDNPYANVDLAALMEGTGGTFVFLDMKRNIQLVHNEERAGTRFPPQSTFKIPNTLIALETGVAKDGQAAIAWDKRKYPKEPWWDEFLKPIGIEWDRDHTLQSAFANSVVWYYKETAKKIGAKRMKSFVERFGFGNMDTSGGIDQFWLESSLQISALEQVEFLGRYVRGELGLSETTRQRATEVLVHTKVDDGTLYAKTGGGSNIGWFVGWVERPASPLEKKRLRRDQQDEVYLFAFNMPGKFVDTAKVRVKRTKQILGELGVWFE